MAFKLKNQIERRENTGEKVIDTNADALDCLPACLDDKDADPAIPIADKRVEDFLNWIIDADAHTTEECYTAYREYMTPITGIRHIDINNMRRMMMKQRIRERIKFLRAAEWEINKPTIIGVTKRLENIINQEENKPADVVNAINTLVKVANIGDANADAHTGGKITVVFNMQEKPKDVIINADAHD